MNPLNCWNRKFLETPGYDSFDELKTIKLHWKKNKQKQENKNKRKRIWKKNLNCEFLKMFEKPKCKKVRYVKHQFWN